MLQRVRTNLGHRHTLHLGPSELQDSFFQSYGCSEVPANAVTACRCSTLILHMPVAVSQHHLLACSSLCPAFSLLESTSHARW
jgi:hypothetical protein